MCFDGSVMAAATFCANSCVLEASKEGMDLFAPKPQKLDQLPQKVCK